MGSEVPWINQSQDPFKVVQTSYDFLTEYLDPDGYVEYSEIPEVNGGTHLYFKDEDKVFIRTTEVFGFGELEAGMDTYIISDDLRLTYNPEFEIQPTQLIISASTGGPTIIFGFNPDGTVASSTPGIAFNEDGSLEIDISNTAFPDMMNSLSDPSESLFIEEQFTIVGSDNGEQAETETILGLMSVSCAEDAANDYNQEIESNVFVEGAEPRLDIDLEFLAVGNTENTSLDGIPLDGTPFDVRFKLRNWSTVTEDNPLSGEVDLGWVVLPIDLEAVIDLDEFSGIDSFNEWLDEYVSLQFQYDYESITYYSSPLNIEDPDFCQIYRTDLGHTGECPDLDLLTEDQYWRVAFDFSKLVDSEQFNIEALYPEIPEEHIEAASQQLALINWYDDTTFNTFRQQQRFSILFSGMEFDHEDFHLKDKYGQDIAGFQTITNENLFEISGVPRAFGLFEIQQPVENVDGLEGFQNVKVVYHNSRNMTDRIDDTGLLTPHFRNYHPETLDTDCPEFIYGGDLPDTPQRYEYFTEFVRDSNGDFAFRNPRPAISPFANPPGIFFPGQNIDVTFVANQNSIGGGAEEEVILNPWDFESGPQVESLFSSDCDEYRVRIALPLAIAHKAIITVTNTTDFASGTESEIVQIVNGQWTAPPSEGDPILPHDPSFADIHFLNSNADASVYILDEGAKGDLQNSNGTVFCADDCVFYIDFKLLGDHLSWNDIQRSIKINILWNSDFACPGLCSSDCIVLPGTVNESAEILVYNKIPLSESGDVCSSNVNEDLILRMARMNQEFFYLCGPPCEADPICIPNSIADADCDATFEYNTVPGNSFRFQRSSFGFNTTDFVGDWGESGDFNGDGEAGLSEAPALSYNDNFGYPEAAFDVFPEATLSDIDPNSLTHFIPGDEIMIRGRGVYSTSANAADVTGLENPRLVYVVQLPVDIDLLDLPEVLTDCSDKPIKLEFRENAGDATPAFEYHATRFFKSNCPYMEGIDEDVDGDGFIDAGGNFECNDDPFIAGECNDWNDLNFNGVYDDDEDINNNGVLDGPEIWTTLIFIFDDFYADDLLVTNGDEWHTTFNGFVFMNPYFEMDPNEEPYIWTAIKGSFALMDNSFDVTSSNENMDTCPVLYTCDNATSAGNFHTLEREISFELASEDGVFDNCTRPFAISIDYSSPTYSDFHDLFADEFRPIFKIESVGLTSQTGSVQRLNFDHHYRGNGHDNADVGLWFHIDGENDPWVESGINFFQKFYTTEISLDGTAMTILPNALSIPRLGHEGNATRTIYGTAEVITNSGINSHQQIGELAVLGHGPQMMSCNAIEAIIQFDYLLDDDWLNYLSMNSCNGPSSEVLVLETLTSDLHNSRVGFTSSDDGTPDVLSQSGVLVGPEINYHDLTGSGTFTMDAFITVKNTDLINVHDVEIVGYDGENIDVDYEPQTPLMVEQNGIYTTYYFHMDYIECENFLPYVNCQNQKLFEEGDRTWRFHFFYNLEECPSGEESTESLIEFYYGQACQVHDADGGITGFTRCQTCGSEAADCPDCNCTPVVNEDLDACTESSDGLIINDPVFPTVSDDAAAIITLTETSSLIGELSNVTQRYSTAFDGFVGEVRPFWPDQFLNATFSTPSSMCNESISIELTNDAGSENMAADAHLHSLLVEVPESWVIAEVTVEGLEESTTFGYTSVINGDGVLQIDFSHLIPCEFCDLPTSCEGDCEACDACVVDHLVIPDTSADSPVTVTIEFALDLDAATVVNTAIPSVEIVANTICNQGITVGVSGEFESVTLNEIGLDVQSQLNYGCSDENVQLCISLNIDENSTESLTIEELVVPDYYDNFSTPSSTDELSFSVFENDLVISLDAELIENLNANGNADICFDIPSPVEIEDLMIQVDVTYSGENCVVTTTTESNSVPYEFLAYEDISIISLGECPALISLPALPEGLYYESDMPLDDPSSETGEILLGPVDDLNVTVTDGNCIYQVLNLIDLQNPCCEINGSTTFTNCVGTVMVDYFTTCDPANLEFIVSTADESNIVNGTSSFAVTGDNSLSVDFDADGSGPYSVTVILSCPGGPECTYETVVNDPAECEPVVLTGDPICDQVEDFLPDPSESMEGNKILDIGGGTYAVFGAANEANDNLDVYSFFRDFDNSTFYSEIGGDVNSPSLDSEVWVDVDVCDNAIYAVGNRRYIDPDYGEISSVIVARFNGLVDGFIGPDLIREIKVEPGSIDEATSIEVMPGGCRVYIAGNTRQGSDADIFVTRLSSNLGSTATRTYDSGYTDKCYDIEMVDYTDTDPTDPSGVGLVLSGSIAGRGLVLSISPMSFAVVNSRMLLTGSSELRTIDVHDDGRIFIGGWARIATVTEDLVLLQLPEEFADPYGSYNAGILSLMTWNNGTDLNADEQINDIEIQGNDIFFVGQSSENTRTGILGLVQLTEGVEFNHNSVNSAQWMAKPDDMTHLKSVALLESPVDGSNEIIVAGDLWFNGDNNTIFVSRSSVDGTGCCYVPFPYEVKGERSRLASPTFTVTAPTPINSGFEPLWNQQYGEHDLCTIGFKSLEDQTSLLILPNPNQGKFELQVEGNSPMRQVSISDATGKLVDLRQFNELDEITVESFNYQHLEAGIYILRVELVNGEILTARAVVNR
ncbi:T9SS type A sorting domain-containing protein [Sanyastnella coralliicola]|uniref:T9SS type A sorting domain-containing protein n=1 Tax=Sanyastnella coralliicola TaxID=3069118 RepID=UPI0027B8F0D7|nr:T9SS type A sorting domain-containing protein [Longitalea sp. SCSIO 12813]